MDMSNVQFDTLMIGPFVIVTLVVAGLIWLAMLGASLKYSIGIFVDETPNYWICIVASLLLIGINVVVAVGLTMTVGPQPWYIISAYQLFLQMILVMMISKCDPFKAFFASFAHGFISSVGTAILAAILLIGYFSAVGGFLERHKSEIANQPAGEVQQNTFAQPPPTTGAVNNPFVQ